MNKKLLYTSLNNKMLFVFGCSLFLGLVSAQAQTCTEPTISAESATICSGNSVTLSAVTDGEDVFWYASQSATTSLAEGIEFTTPTLNATTSYWVEAVNYGDSGASEVITNGAKVSPTSTGGTSVVSGTSPWGLVFNAYEDFVLNSVDVFLTGAGGDVVINLLDSNWAVMDTTTKTLPSGGSTSSPLQHTITLDFSVPQGSGYRLVAVSSPPMIRDLGSNSFPYPIGSVGAVTAGSISTNGGNPGVYYFFYNWTVTVGAQEECVSDRIEVVVNVNPTPSVPTGNAVQVLDLGSTIADLDVSGEGLTWYADAGLTQEISVDTILVNGLTYYVTQTVGDCTSGALAIEVIVQDPCVNVTIPLGETEQTIEEGGTLADLAVIGDNLTWYADAELTQELPDTTEVVNGMTYYVTQTIGECISGALAVTVTVTLDRGNFDKYNFSFYPNPTQNVLYITSDYTISEVFVHNLLGQKMNVKLNGNSLDLSRLSSGNYLLSVTIDHTTEVFRIVKK